MTIYNNQPTQKANAVEKNFYNHTRSRSGICVSDTPFGETALGLYVSVAGNVVLEGTDGVPNYLPALTVGVEHPFKFRRVLTSAVIDGNTYTTSATGIVWVGGES